MNTARPLEQASNIAEALGKLYGFFVVLGALGYFYAGLGPEEPAMIATVGFLLGFILSVVLVYGARALRKDSAQVRRIALAMVGVTVAMIVFEYYVYQVTQRIGFAWPFLFLILWSLFSAHRASDLK